jgi:hypothetical protein
MIPQIPQDLLWLMLSLLINTATKELLFTLNISRIFAFQCYMMEALFTAL